jgi:hypothetical protein
MEMPEREYHFNTHVLNALKITIVCTLRHTEALKSSAVIGLRDLNINTIGCFGNKMEVYLPLNIFTCCSSIHKYKSPFFGALLTKTVTRNSSIIFRILIRLEMSNVNILKQKKFRDQTTPHAPSP